ncbi:MAG: GWxTD domain-containing protein [Candidatus Zhuqueibacterota bacterium]
MMKRKLCLYGALILLTGLFFPLTVHTQVNQAEKITQERFDFSFDCARFRSQQGFVLLELYYSVFRNYLQFEQVDSVWEASFNFKTEVWQNDSLLASDSWPNFHAVDSLHHILPGQKLYGIGYFGLRAGSYTLKLNLTDTRSNFAREKIQEVTIEPFSEDGLDLSDIELASRIEPAKEKSRFYKNSYLVIPNTDQFYGTGLPMLMFYCEIYNLKKADEPDTSKYAVSYKIFDGDGQSVRQFPAKIRTKPGASAVEVSGMNIISFRSGTYFFELTVKDLFSGNEVSRRKKFYIYREGDLAVPDSVSQKQVADRLKASMDRVYSTMSTDNMDEEFDAASYLATGDEKKIYKTLDAVGKQKFLMEFWASRDQTIGTPQNEFRDNYLALMRTANENFTGFKKGYKTDRGRILLVYGVPDEIERVPYSSENKAYMIWKYFSIQGGVDFVFVDKRGIGDLELVNSTARGELNDPNWERWINPN